MMDLLAGNVGFANNFSELKSSVGVIRRARKVLRIDQRLAHSSEYSSTRLITNRSHVAADNIIVLDT
jgi:hypothetical protein